MVNYVIDYCQLEQSANWQKENVPLREYSCGNWVMARGRRQMRLFETNRMRKSKLCRHHQKKIKLVNEINLQAVR